MKAKKITIQEIAKIADVHPSTVSRVINNNKKGVSEKTREKIKGIIELMGYYPNERAQNFRKKQARAIGIVTSKSSGYIFSKHFFHKFIEGVANSLKVKDISIILDFNEKDPFTKIFHQNRVDGIIVVSIQEKDKRIFELINSGYPFVFVGQYGFYDVPSIISDNEGGAQALIEHFIKLGYREIGFIGGPLFYPPYKERFEGYKKAMYINNIPIKQEWIIELDSFDENSLNFRNTIRAFLKNKDHPKALFVYEDMAAAIVIREAQNMGVKVPEELAVGGYDDIPLSSFITPALTTVRQPMQKIGVEAAKMLLEIISNENAKNSRVVLENELVIRQSCGYK